jgi:hypothetical protein
MIHKYNNRSTNDYHATLLWGKAYLLFDSGGSEQIRVLGLPPFLMSE